MRRKGASGLPMTVLVGIVLATLLILVALVMLGIIPVFQGAEAYKGHFFSCCTAYQIGGYCEAEATDYNFKCSIDPNLVPSGEITISDLASRAGVPMESCCK